MIKEYIEKARKEKERRKEQLVVHREKLNQSISELRELDATLATHEGYTSMQDILSIEKMFPSLTKETFNKEEYLKEYERYSQVFDIIKNTIQNRIDEAQRIIKEYLDEDQQQPA